MGNCKIVQVKLFNNATLITTVSELLESLKNGCRLEKPSLCHYDIYDMMTQCWHLERRKRPTFSSILDFLETHFRNSNTNSLIPMMTDIQFTTLTELAMLRRSRVKLNLYMDEPSVFASNYQPSEPHYVNGYHLPTNNRENIALSVF